MKRFHKTSDRGPLNAPEHVPDPERSGRRHLSLQSKFQIGLGAIFLVFCAVTAWLIYHHEQTLLKESALSKSHLVMAAVESTRSYIRDTLRPTMYELEGPDAFVLEAMSTSYITREVMDRFNKNLPEYQYRRVSINARNPDSEPTAVERNLIDYFQANPNRTVWQGMKSHGDNVGFIHARPVYMNESCLNCHGRPEDAPRDLIEQYGDQRGFGYRAGDLAGISAVSIPVHVALSKIKSRAVSVFWVTMLLLTFLYVLISFLFNRTVVQSLKGLLNVFRQGLVDDRELELFREASEQVEIDELTEAAQALTDHLKSARKKLADYAGHLEQMVAERTRALEESRSRLREKVVTRNRELRTLNRIAELITRSFKLADILPGVLEQTLGLIPAKGAAIYLLSRHDDGGRLEIECHRNADKLEPTVTCDHAPEPGTTPESLKAAIWEAARGKMSIFACRRNENCLNVPLICRDRVLGVMTYVGVDFSEVTPEMHELLLSIGQQIGITVESLNNVAALLNSKELLQSVFDGIPDMMVLLDRDLTIRMVNQAYLDSTGFILEEVIDQPCRKQNSSKVCPLMGKEHETVFATRREAREEIRTEDGRIFLVHYYPILDETGNVVRLLRHARDITLEKQVEQRIQQTEKLAALGQLAAGVAHEINNPMGIMLCYVDLLKRQLPDDDQVHKDVDTIAKQARNCQRIVSDLLNFASGKKAERKLAQVNTAVREVVDMVDHQFRKQGTSIRTTLDGNLPMFELDADKIKQVFLNLLMNARQAISGSNGRIDVTTRFMEQTGTVEISFRDNGTGIAPEIAEKIFDPFFSTKKTGEGTGLGLSVSYGIVKDHGGDIRLETEPGHWTRFTVILPTTGQEL